MREYETQLRALIEVSAQIVWTTDAAGLGVADSPSWRTFTGQTHNEWMGRGWLGAVHPEDREHADATWRQAVESVTPLDTEFRLRHVSGGWRWMVFRAVPLRNPEGVVDGRVGMNTDITKRKQAEEALRILTATLEQRVAERTGELEQAHDPLRSEMAERQRMQEALFQRKKLAALGLLLANVAHELNNPLSVATLETDNLADTIVRAWSSPFSPGRCSDSSSRCWKHSKRTWRWLSEVEYLVHAIVTSVSRHGGTRPQQTCSV